VGDDGALEAEVEVLDRAAGVVVEAVAGADVDAAGEAEAAVGHEQLAVGAQVEGHEVQEIEGGEEAGVGDVFVAQGVEDGGKGIARAGGVHEHADLDAAPDGLAEGVGEVQAGFVAVEDVGFQGDAAAGLGDGVEHGGVGGVPVHQWVQAVARQEGALDDALDDAGQHFEVAGLGGQVPVKLFRQASGGGGLGLVAFEVSAQGGGLAANAVDAEDEIGQGADQRGDPNEADPAQGGARIALVENGVSGRHHGGEQGQRRQDEVPDLVRAGPEVGCVWHRRLI
jgi:hypothetical protein